MKKGNKKIYHERNNGLHGGYDYHKGNRLFCGEKELIDLSLDRVISIYGQVFEYPEAFVNRGGNVLKPFQVFVEWK